MRGLVALLLLLARVARADVPTPAAVAAAAVAAPTAASAAAPADARTDARLRHRLLLARTRRDVGIAVGAIGLAGIATGAILMAYAYYDIPTNTQTGYDAATTMLATGIASTVVGGVVGGLGAWLAVDGQIAMTETQWRMGLITYVAPVRDGALVGVSTRF